MARYAGQKRRATTQKTYAMDKNYDKVLTEAKRLHRYDGEFYITMIKDYYSSVSILDYQTYRYDEEKTEHWKFENKRWKKLSGMDK